MSKDYKLKDYTAEYGKLPPQAVDLEEAVLSAMMLEADAFSQVGDMLEPETFYKSAHQKIFAAIQRLVMRNDPVDLLTVSQELNNSGELEEVGGYAYLSQLSSKVASAANIDFHAKILIQKYLRRQLITSCTELQNMSYDESVDVVELIDKAQKSVYDIADTNIRKETSTLPPLLADALKGIEKAGENIEGISGVPSGFTEIDKITHGWQPSDLVIIAARPAMGKTAFVLSMARNIAVNSRIPIAVFSLEMSGIQLVNRLISSEAELESEKLKTGQLTNEEWQHLKSKVQSLAEAPIYVDDTPALSVMELRSKCRNLKNKYDIQVVVVDYLQLMTAGADMRGNRVQEVSIISRQLKIIAKELGITMIALSQLNRSLETRDNKKPMLSDLRESGSIEQDADMVLFIHRPEVYKKTDDQGNSLKGLAEIIIAKHRNGKVGEIKLRFRGQYTQFVDWDTIPDFQKTSGRLIKSVNIKSTPDDGGGVDYPALQDTFSKEGSKSFEYGAAAVDPMPGAAAGDDDTPPF